MPAFQPTIRLPLVRTHHLDNLTPRTLTLLERPDVLGLIVTIDIRAYQKNLSRSSVTVYPRMHLINDQGGWSSSRRLDDQAAAGIADAATLDLVALAIAAERHHPRAREQAHTYTLFLAHGGAIVSSMFTTEILGQWDAFIVRHPDPYAPGYAHHAQEAADGLEAAPFGIIMLPTATSAHDRLHQHTMATKLLHAKTVFDAHYDTDPTPFHWTFGDAP